jgi:hypothetical protein
MIEPILIFTLILFANAFEIIGFNRACGYQLILKKGKPISIDPTSKMIFWKFGWWCETTFGAFYSKPIYSCCTCMSSLHGIVPFWFTFLLLYQFTPMAFVYWAFYTLVLAGVSSKLNR